MTLSGQPSALALRYLISIVLGVSLAQAAAAQSTPQVSPGAAQPLPPATAPVTHPVDESLLSVPPIVDRPLGVDEGPKIHVTRFKLTGAGNHPHESLSVADFQKILDDALRAQTVEGYTVNQMQAIAGKIALAYRAKGFVLAQAFVPAQDVHNGEVEVRVLEGKLGAVRIEGNKHYRTSTLQAPFNGVRGQAVSQNDVEARLLRLSDYPGLTVFGVFTPGKAVGDSDLVLKVQREKPLDFSIGADNFGNPFNGEYRGRVGFAWNDPLGIGDRFQASFLKARSSGSSSTGADTKFYSADYRVPFAAGRAALDADYSKNDYAAGGALNGLIFGLAKIGEVGVEVETSRSRLGRSYVFLKGASKRGELSEPTGTQTERLGSGELGVAIDRTDRGANGRWMAQISALHGSNSVKSLATIRASSDSSYSVGRFDVQRIQRLAPFQNLRFKLAGQMTSNGLPTLEQSALGGPNSVRAYEVAHFVADKSLSGTAEWYIGAPGFASSIGPGKHPWGQLLQFVVFYDIAKGWLNNPLPGEIANRELKGAGVGLAFNLPGRFYMRIDASKAMSPEATDKSSVYFKSTRIYGSFGLTF